jgi:hypothetical protein
MAMSIMLPEEEPPAACGKSRVCHPEPASFAGEGSAVRKKAKKKADSSPRQKPNGVRNDTFSLFPHPARGSAAFEQYTLQ